ncbi:uncharacterized protein CCR75_004665 [Bremia lactucae]|uniref:Retinoblastoma-associated protein n=1 Tax=Bremia lactucae TaxID=4779 RepID=A0A976FQU1_BRELC|nr:hypothetical protein CCR75_004665 [Bremia lactucae]
MAGTLSRFFASASMEGAFARIRTDAVLLQTSQVLYDQILPSASTIGIDESNARSKENEPDKIWAYVAVVATGMTYEIQHEFKASTERCFQWHLIELLTEAGVSLQDFLLYFTSLFNRLLLTPELLAATTLLKEDFTIVTLLFEKFRILWETFVPIQSLNAWEPENESESYEDRQMRFRQRHLFQGGWLLFLVAKRRLHAQYSGLGQLYTLLLATLHVVLQNAQASQATIEAEVAAALSAMGALGEDKASPRTTRDANVLTSAQIMQALCAMPIVNPQDVSCASEDLTRVLQQLKDEHVLQKDVRESSTLSVALFTDTVLDTNVSSLKQRYELEYLKGCGKLDERFFLDAHVRRTILGPSPLERDTQAPDDFKSGSTIVSSGRCHIMVQQRENHSLTSVSRNLKTPPRHCQPRYHLQSRRHSPLKHSWQWQGSPTRTRLVGSSHTSPRTSPRTFDTPVTAAVETNQWVREILSSTMLTPVTPQLRQFFTTCQIDPTERIARVLREHSDLLLAARKQASRATLKAATPRVTDFVDTDNAVEQQYTRFSSGVDDSLKRTKNLTIVLFYRVLEPLLVAERTRLGNADFSKLLNNEIFLSALFACSAEVILKAHSLITISYPFLLEHLHVNVFHFVTTSESFVKYAPQLPSALKRHMGNVKHRILDAAVWASKSALYQLLPFTNQATSGTDKSVPIAPSATHAPVLRLFFRMVLSRAAVRIHQFCGLLELDVNDQNQIWTAVKECMTSHQYLLRDRHLDLIVLCNIYAVCKVSRGPNVSHAAATMSFKRLLACYNQLTRQASTGSNGSTEPLLHLARSGDGVTYDIRLEDDNSRGDIIKFYNRCYITSMKVFILQFQCQESQMAAADAVVAEAANRSQTLTPGFLSRREGPRGVAAATSDAECISRAASNAVQKLLQTTNETSRLNNFTRVPVNTPPRPICGALRSSPFVSSPIVPALQMFTSAEVQTLPIALTHTSPKRVKLSNVFLSPLQQVRLDRRSELTPRSHALYAIGESPARVRFERSFDNGKVDNLLYENVRQDLALINRAVNTGPRNLRRVRAPELMMESDSEHETRLHKKQKARV